MSLVTCHTEGCPNAEIPIELATSFVDEETGETVRVGSVTCGACGQPITDIQEPQNEEEEPA